MIILQILGEEKTKRSDNTSIILQASLSDKWSENVDRAADAASILGVRNSG